MILENGTVRTMDTSLPTPGALAIAGDRIAGGVGTHETALASPEVVDLGGRCVIPGFTDSHVHFPTWAIARRQVRLEDATSLEEALERIAPASARQPGPLAPRPGLARDDDWPAPPTKDGARRRHRRRARRADREGLPLALAQLRCARAARTATCEVRGRRRRARRARRADRAAPRGVGLALQGATTSSTPTTSTSRRCARA